MRTKAAFVSANPLFCICCSLSLILPSHSLLLVQRYREDPVWDRRQGLPVPSVYDYIFGRLCDCVCKELEAVAGPGLCGSTSCGCIHSHCQSRGATIVMPQHVPLTTFFLLSPSLFYSSLVCNLFNCKGAKGLFLCRGCS